MASQARELANKTTAAAGRKNLIINGAMKVAQRGTKSLSTDGYTACDRFLYDVGNSYAATFNTTQDSDAPEGFSNSLKLDCTVADSIASDEHNNFRYKIEAQDLQHLLYGTSNAKAVTLSFWVKSNQTADFSVALFQDDAIRIIGSTYTISDADTWEYKTITFAGDTGGTINDDNGTGLQFIFGLTVADQFKATDNTSWGAYTSDKFGYGHTATIGASTSDYLQITGVQLEVGSVATDFEHRSYGEELLVCKRYFEKLNSPMMSGVTTSSYSARRMGIQFEVEKRATPTVILVGTMYIYNGSGTGTLTDSNITTEWRTLSSYQFDANVTISGQAAKDPTVSYILSTGGVIDNYFTVDSEL